MKKNLATIAAFGALTSCRPAPEATALDSVRRQMTRDSIKGITEAKQLAEDTYIKGVQNGYLAILNMTIIPAERGSRKLVIKVVNISNKVVDGIQFNWSLRNEAGDFVGSILHTNALSRETIHPGDTLTINWNLYETTATKVSVYPVRIHFADGSSWAVR